MTNWDLRQKIDGVDVKKRTVTVDVMAPRGRPAGRDRPGRPRVHDDGRHAEAGDGPRTAVPQSRATGRWRIFGYDVSKGAK